MQWRLLWGLVPSIFPAGDEGQRQVQHTDAGRGYDPAVQLPERRSGVVPPQFGVDVDARSGGQRHRLSVHDPAREASDALAVADELRAGEVERGESPHNFPSSCFTWKELEPKIEDRRSLVLTAWDIADSEKWHRLDFTPALSYAGQLPAFIQKVKEMLARIFPIRACRESACCVF